MAAGAARRIPEAGLFEPGSISWRVDREAVVLAGGTCALLMQIAHPAVAAGVDAHSDFQVDPFARLR
ncbi:MAG TPA: oxygenase MpaB family protein, partial [Candidatus Limnocylindria bacterium]|nr:oxygenase MpaB family protein [Candidatus Limnocylindria bacterium]